MITIKNVRGNNKYTGSIVVTAAMEDELDLSFNTKFEAFCYGVEQGWSKKSIMRVCLNTEREQYFHNYYTKYLASKNS